MKRRHARHHAANRNGSTRSSGMARCCALLAAAMLAACTSQAGGSSKPLVLVDQQFFAQCPFEVAPSSLTLVTDLPAWQKLLATATLSPPPFEAAATQFAERSVLILATATTGTPRTSLLAHGDGLSVEAASGKLKLEVEVRNKPPVPGEVVATVLGTPCLVLWTSRAVGVKTIYARDAKTGAMLAQTKLP